MPIKGPWVLLKKSFSVFLQEPQLSALMSSLEGSLISFVVLCYVMFLVDFTSCNKHLLSFVGSGVALSLPFTGRTRFVTALGSNWISPFGNSLGEKVTIKINVPGDSRSLFQEHAQNVNFILSWKSSV